MYLFIYFFFLLLHKLKIELQESNQNTTKMGEFNATWVEIRKLGNNESDVNLNICSFDQVLSHWFPTRKSPTQVWAGWPSIEGGVGGARPSRMKMWSSLGHFTGDVLFGIFWAKIGWDSSVSKSKGHFTHQTKSPWPLHFKHSHWWKRQSWSKFPSQYACRSNGGCECKTNVKSTWVPTWHRMDHVSWLLGLFSKTTSWR
jgi:hypothetical protein